jgi:hypothetical protein
MLTSKDLNPIASWTLVGTKLNLHTAMLRLSVEKLKESGETQEKIITAGNRIK